MSEIECRYSCLSETEQLKDLWEICFGDDRPYIDLFFKYMFKENRTCVLTRDRVIAAMVTALEVTYSFEGVKFPGVMLYGVATHPDERGKGFSTLLMDYVNKEHANRGVKVSVLVPAEPSLIDFYKKRGYKEVFTVCEGNIDFFENEGGSSVLLEPSEALEYNKCRNTFLGDQCSIQYSDEDLLFQKSSAQLTGGDLFKISCGQTFGCAVVERMSPEKILVKELLIRDDLVLDALKRIRDFFAAKEILVRLPGDHPSVKGGVRVFGMAKVLDSSLIVSPEGYLGLAFD